MTNLSHVPILLANATQKRNVGVFLWSPYQWSVCPVDHIAILRLVPGQVLVES